MSSQMLIKKSTLEIPVKCKCDACNEISEGMIRVEVSGEGYLNSGSPFGRKERAQNEAEYKLKNNMMYHIINFYEEMEKNPAKSCRFVQPHNCASCGKIYPWGEIVKQAVEEEMAWRKKGIIKKLIAKIKKEPRQTFEDYALKICEIDHEYLPAPQVPKEDLCAKLDLKYADGTDTSDMGAFFIHKINSILP